MNRRIDSLRFSGFTLVEMSVIIIMVGLIVGAIVVGKELVTSATMRRTASQIKEVQTAVTLFRERYQAMPGDFAKASKYWSAESAEDGDGNGKIDGGYEGSNGNEHSSTSYECYNVWHHLRLSDLFPTSAGAVTSNVGTSAVAPRAAVDNSYITMHFDVGLNTADKHANYLMITRVPNCMRRAGLAALLLGTAPVVYNNDSPAYNLLAWLISDAMAAKGDPPADVDSGSNVGILPANAAALDQKIDDGLPFSGTIRSALGTLSSTSKICATDNATQYNTSLEKFVCGVWVSFDTQRN